MNGTLRGVLLGASVLAVSVATGCSRSELAETTAPQSAYVEPPASAPTAAPAGRIQTTELLGGPMPGATASVAPPPPASPRASFGKMAPIPNPEDLNWEERARVYGAMAPIPNPENMSRAQRNRVYPQQTSVASAASYGRPANAGPEQAAGVDGQRTVRRAPQPNRPAVATTARPAVAAPAGPVSTRPVVPAPKPAAPAPAIAAKPAVPAAKPAAPVVAAKPAAPVVAAAPVKPAAPVVPAKPQTKAEQLGALLAADVTAGLKFDVPAAMVTGQDSIVTATVPEGLLERAQTEAGKLGLTVPARRIDLRGTLSGEGYTLTPNVPQVATLQKGEATTFSWQVRPTGEARQPLKLVLGGELKGGAKPQAFPITTIQKDVAAPAPAKPAKKGFVMPKFLQDLFARKDAATQAPGETSAPAAKGASFLDRFSIPGRETVVTPVFGEVKSSNVVLGGLGVLVALVLAALAGQASGRRKSAERRRKFRTMADFGGTDTAEQPVPEPQHSYRAPEPVAAAPVAVAHAEPVAAAHDDGALSRATKAHDTAVVHAHDGETARKPEHV